jgi:hypothetical protein
VIVFVAIGRAARHAQHSEPAGAEESRDQDGGEDQDILLSKVFSRRARVIDTAELRTLLHGS